MEAGIVGLPNVGKSTLFNALTAVGADSANYPFCTIEPNVGIVPIPDDRLDILSRYIESRQITSATLRLVDIAGLVRGASEGEGLGNQFLSHIREVDAVLHVVRCFEDENVTHVEASLDPVRDIETIETELMLADLQVAEGAFDRARRASKGGDKEVFFRAALLERCVAELSEGRPLRSVTFEDPRYRALLRGLGLITAKKVLYVANVDEDDPKGESSRVEAIREYAGRHGGKVVPVCARLEAELAELPEEDRRELLESLGMAEPALAVVARASYELLGLCSFFTVGPKEIRAWPIPVGTKAPEAAGTVHSDFERGFIRVEVYAVQDLAELKSEAAIRAAGRMRVEGRNYVVQDGDVCRFLFNVSAS